MSRSIAATRLGQLLPRHRQLLGGGPQLIGLGRDALEDLTGLGFEAISQLPHHPVALPQVGEQGGTRHRLDAADPRRQPRLGDDAEQADLGGVGTVRSSGTREALAIRRCPCRS